MIILKGDKIKQAKEIMGFNYVGEEFEVTDVDMGVISFVCGMGRGVMSYDELEKYFEKVVKEQWSEWELDNYDCEYRVKGMLIEYSKPYHGSVFAKCLPEDEFDLEVGLDICRKKMKIRELEKELKQYRSK